MFECRVSTSHRLIVCCCDGFCDSLVAEALAWLWRRRYLAVATPFPCRSPPSWFGATPAWHWPCCVWLQVTLAVLQFFDFYPTPSHQAGWAAPFPFFVPLAYVDYQPLPWPYAPGSLSAHHLFVEMRPWGCSCGCECNCSLDRLSRSWFASVSPVRRALLPPEHADASLRVLISCFSGSSILCPLICLDSLHLFICSGVVLIYDAMPLSHRNNREWRQDQIKLLTLTYYCCHWNKHEWRQDQLNYWFPFFCCCPHLRFPLCFLCVFFRFVCIDCPAAMLLLDFMASDLWYVICVYV